MSKVIVNECEYHHPYADIPDLHGELTGIPIEEMCDAVNAEHINFCSKHCEGGTCIFDGKNEKALQTVLDEGQSIMQKHILSSAALYGQN